MIKMTEKEKQNFIKEILKGKNSYVLKEIPEKPKKKKSTKRRIKKR